MSHYRLYNLGSLAISVCAHSQFARPRFLYRDHIIELALLRR